MNFKKLITHLLQFKKKPFKYPDIAIEQYNFIELSQILNNFSLNVHVEHQIMVAKWESPKYKIHIEYNEQGVFQKVLLKEEVK